MDTLSHYVMEYIEYCEYRKRLDRKTLKAYRIDLKQYEAFCLDSPDCFSKNLVDRFITNLHRQYRPKTVKRKIASLKAFFHYLEYKELLDENPFTKLDIRFREAKLLPKTIPFYSIQTFLSALYTQKEQASSKYQLRCCIRDIAVIELLFATGMRISELCSLKPSDIDLKSNTVLIYGKGAKERILQFGNPEVIAALTLYHETFKEDIERCGYFFVNRLQHRLSDQSVRFMINRYAALAGINQHITPHMFRHSFATLLLEQDVDIRYIQRMLGHSSISTTEIYTHVSNAKQKDILVHKHPRNLIEVNKG
ncbi:MAG: tyrosine-type recombinase/integrase [Lachnospiraceae bacterium]|nr:tyrosine-type recombinase/integrase [Lachnospiraceae bacterium]